MFLEKIVVGPFQCNCSILACEKTREAIIIDPGDEADRILEIIRRDGLKPKYLLHTHAHLDHVGATEEVASQAHGEVCLHREDQFLYDNMAMQTALFNLPSFSVPPVKNYLEDKDVLKFGEHKIEVLHTPGHTPGSVTFYIPPVGAGLVSALPANHLKLDGQTQDLPLLFTGDTLFMGSIGRTDLWGGDFGQILHSIKNKLLPFNDETQVYPGHGPETTIGAERQHNPFLTGKFY